MNVRVFLRCIGLLFALAVFAGCGRTKAPLAPSSKLASPTLDGTLDGATRGFGAFEPRLPAASGGANFFPLDSGSVWIYAREARTVFLPPAAPDTFTELSTVTTRMLGKYDFGGTLYSLSTETTFRDERALVDQIYYRQDVSGLYELDAPIRDPVGPAHISGIHDAVLARLARETPVRRAAMLRALAGVEARIARIDGLLHAPHALPATGPQGQPEIQRLAYPLYLGRQWILRTDPLFTERVEARESVVVGGQRLSAWRIRIESELFGPDDRVWIWYSHQGELRFRYHVEGIAVDDAGNPVGTVVTDLDQRLVEYHLAGATLPGGTTSGGAFGGRTTLREVGTH